MKALVPMHFHVLVAAAPRVDGAAAGVMKIAMYVITSERRQLIDRSGVLCNNAASVYHVGKVCN